MWQKHHRLASVGFTLVELLAVVAMTGVLLGLLPAVQSARTAAGPSPCMHSKPGQSKDVHGHAVHDLEGLLQVQHRPVIHGGTEIASLGETTARQL